MSERLTRDDPLFDMLRGLQEFDDVNNSDDDTDDVTNSSDSDRDSEAGLLAEMAELKSMASAFAQQHSGASSVDAFSQGIAQQIAGMPEQTAFSASAALATTAPPAIHAQASTVHPAPTSDVAVRPAPQQVAGAAASGSGALVDHSASLADLLAGALLEGVPQQQQQLHHQSSNVGTASTGSSANATTTAANPRLSMRAYMTGNSWIPKTDQQELRELQNQPWFFQEATEDDAVKHLTAASTNPKYAGSSLFLVRPSIIGYCISAYMLPSKAIKHFEIFRLPNSLTFKLMEDIPGSSSRDDVEFRSVSELIAQTPLLRGFMPVFVSEDAEKLDDQIGSLLLGLTAPPVVHVATPIVETEPEQPEPSLVQQSSADGAVAVDKPPSAGSVAEQRDLTTEQSAKSGSAVTISVTTSPNQVSNANRAISKDASPHGDGTATNSTEQLGAAPERPATPSSPRVSDRVNQLSTQKLGLSPKQPIKNASDASKRSSSSLKKLFSSRGNVKGSSDGPSIEEIKAQRLHLLRRPSTAMIGDLYRAGLSQDNAPSFTGYLTKLGGHGVKSNWRRRYFVMPANGSMLQYFKDAKDTDRALGTVILDSYNTVSDGSGEQKKRFCFKLSHSEHTSIRPLFLVADTAESFAAWYARLAEVFQTAQERKLAARASPDDATARVERSVWLTVSEARNLKKKCDAYAIVTAGSHKVQTQTIKKSKDPLWGESYEFALDVTDATIVVSILDAAKDDVLGRVEIPVFSLQQKPSLEGWYPLVPHEAKHLVTGCILLAVESNPPVEQAAGRLTVRIISGKNLSKKKELTATVQWGKNSSHTRKQSSLLGSASIASSSDIVDDVNWNEDFTYEVPVMADGAQVYDLIVDINSGDDFCGRAVASLDGITRRAVSWRRYVLLGPKVESVIEEKERQDLIHSIRTAQAQAAFGASGVSDAASGLVSGLALEGKDTKQLKTMLQGIQNSADAAKDGDANKGKSLGDLRLKVRYEEQVVLPLIEYETLLILLEDRDSGFLHHLVAACDQDPSSRELCAKTLCRIGEARNNVAWFVTELCVAEIRRTESTDTLFRGNSVATKALDFYQKLVAMPWLKTVLGPHIEKLFAIGNKGGWEIDPTRLAEKESAQKNSKCLQELLQAIVDDIFGSVDQCPSSLVSIYSAMVKACQETFSKTLGSDIFGRKQVESAQFTAVSSFLFLRLWAPALLGPKLFGLADEHPNEKNGRLLTLCSKTLQTLSNLVQFGPKEPFMAEHLNEFLARNTQPMRNFLTTVSQPPASTSSFASHEMADINLDFELATMQRICSGKRDAIFAALSAAAPTGTAEDVVPTSPPTWLKLLDDQLVRLDKMCAAVAERDADEGTNEIIAAASV